LKRLEDIKQQLLETTGEEARVHAKLRGASSSGLKAEFDANRDALFDALGMLHKVETTLQEASYGGAPTSSRADRNSNAKEVLEQPEVSPEHGTCLLLGGTPAHVACRPSRIRERLPSRESSARDAHVSNVPVRTISAPSGTIGLKPRSGSAERQQPDIGSKANQNCEVARSVSATLPDHAHDGQNFWESVMRVGASAATAAPRSRSSSPVRTPLSSVAFRTTTPEPTTKPHSATPTESPGIVRAPSNTSSMSARGSVSALKVSLRQRAAETVPGCLTAGQHQETTESPRHLRRRSSPGRILGHRGRYQPTSPTAMTAGTGMRQARPPPCTSSVLRHEQHPLDIGSIPTKDLRSHSGSRAAYSGNSAELDAWSVMGNSTHSRSRGASQSTEIIGPSNDGSDAEQFAARHLDMMQRPRWAEILAELDMMNAAFGADHEQQTESSQACSSKQLLCDAAGPPGPLLVREQSAPTECLRPAAVVDDRCSVSPLRPVGLVVSSTLPNKGVHVKRQAVKFPLVATPANARIHPPGWMLAIPPPRKQVGLRTGTFNPMVAGSGSLWHGGGNIPVASPRVAGQGC